VGSAAGGTNEAISLVLAEIATLPVGRRQIVAVDGIDGAGKTTFADGLASRTDRPVLRASEDDFHNPRAIRYRRGRWSPEGYYRDSFDIGSLVSLLLAPFARGEAVCVRAFDHLNDRPVTPVLKDAAQDALLILDGIFLHQDALRGWWDVSVWLDVSPATAADRFAEWDGQPPHRRYVKGQELYLEEVAPQAHATIVVPW
jgi:uridine kinase